MPSVTVHLRAPQDLAEAVGPAKRAKPGVTFLTALWSGLAQNTTTTRTIYRLRSETKPAQNAPAFRHRPGEIFRLTHTERGLSENLGMDGGRIG